MRRINKSLHLCVLDQKQHEQTCNYWYTITERGMSHTAFRTEQGLMRYLDERGLKLTEPLTSPGVFSWQRIEGQYAEEAHLYPDEVDEFYTLKTIVTTKDLSNGDYTLALITEDNGLRTVHTLNPNVKDRPIFDYFDSHKEMN